MKKMKDIFFKDKSEYNNQLNPLKGYLEQITQFISVKKNLPLDQARQKAIVVLKKYFKDKPIKYFEREENGDRVVKDGTLFNYIKENVNNKNILAPTFTSYMNSNVKKSLLSEFIFINVGKRSIAKKASQKAKAEGKMDLSLAKNNEQNMMKIYNNALSGVFGQEACVLHNPTAHNTLTSITRTMTSLSNASNEKLIAGNRYLPRGIDVLNSIVYISTYTDANKVKQLVEKYNLHLPTVEETVSVLKYSSDLYFYDKLFYEKHIIPYLQNLTPYHLAGICYSGDLYHLRKFNSNFIFNLLTELITPVKGKTEKLEDTSVIHKLDESIVNFVHTIFYSKLKGYGKDYEKMNNDNIASDIYETTLNVINVLTKYKDFFNVFFMNEIFPTNSNRLTNLRRRTVVLSDTDSTCFTLDEWVKWYKGQFFIDDSTIALAGCISYIASQAIVNSLAIISKSMNVEDKLLNTLSMKNEYLWQVHTPCNISKHYFAYTVIQEGNVFKEPDIEIKGVHLKNSAVPKFVIQDAKDLIKYILSTVAKNEKIKFNYVLKNIIALENNINESVYKGEPVYLKKSKIKNAEAYALEGSKSPYSRHVFWREVFAPTYGEIQEPPYDVIKIPTIVTTRVKMLEWLETIEDIELKGRLTSWLEKNNKTNLPTVYLNETYILGNGIPKEILSIIDIKRIILDVTIQHRTIFETLGIMLNEDKLIKEQFINV